MKRRNQEIQIFSVSFLDLLSCALGGVLVILILTISIDRKAVGDAKGDSDYWQGEADKRGADAEKTAADSEKYKGDAEKARGDAERHKADAKKAHDNAKKFKGEADKARGEAEKSKSEADKANGLVTKFKGEAEKAQGNAEKYKREADKAQDDVTKHKGEADAARSKAQAATAENQKLKGAQAGLIGLKGKLKNVVFVFDTSGSMAKYLDSHKQWLKNLVVDLQQFEQFNVVRFGTDVESWSKSGFKNASVDNRQLAASFIERFKADGHTNTLGAFQEAFKNEGVDTIIFFSDGAPTLFENGKPVADREGLHVREKEAISGIMKWVRDENKSRSVVINTIGLGNYFTEDYGTFLRQMAEEHGGVFIGR